MTFIPIVTANVSVLNSTTSKLTAGATFTGHPTATYKFPSRRLILLWYKHDLDRCLKSGLSLDG